mgnify:CR=1 FL=1
MRCKTSLVFSIALRTLSSDEKENLKQEFCRFVQSVNKTPAENAENQFDRNKLF